MMAPRGDTGASQAKSEGLTPQNVMATFWRMMRDIGLGLLTVVGLTVLAFVLALGSQGV